MRDIAIVCGPTAAGKSALATAIAERVGAVILSADSRQVYRHFDIGTAKPSPGDRARVPHRGVDLIEPTDRYSAAAWAADVEVWRSEADAARRPVIVVGGTGFYLRALETPLFESPPLDATARALVQAELAAVPTDVLRDRVSAIDPSRASFGRTQLLRALEVHALTGVPLSEWQRERAREATVRPNYLVVDPGAVLRERIAARIDRMLAQGWEREVAQLAQTVPAEAPAWNACGYGALRDALDGTATRAAAIERTIIETRQYAKRQRTWFRHQLPVDRVSHVDPLSRTALDEAMAWYHAVPDPENL